MVIFLFQRSYFIGLIHRSDFTSFIKLDNLYFCSFWSQIDVHNDERCINGWSCMVCLPSALYPWLLYYIISCKCKCMIHYKLTKITYMQPTKTISGLIFALLTINLMYMMANGWQQHTHTHTHKIIKLMDSGKALGILPHQLHTQFSQMYETTLLLFSDYILLFMSFLQFPPDVDGLERQL